MSKGKGKWVEIKVRIWRLDFKRRKGEVLLPLEQQILDAWDATGNTSISAMFDMSPWWVDDQIKFRDRGFTEQSKFLNKLHIERSVN